MKKEEAAGLVEPLLLDLDDLDILLVKELEIDARRSNLELASRLGISPSTVARRIQRLLDSKVVSITAMVDPWVFGLHTNAMLGMKTLPGEASAVAERLREISTVRTIILTTGLYDLFLSANFRSQEALFDFVEGTLGGIPELTDVETMMIFRVAKNSWKHIGGDTGELTRAEPRPLDQSEGRLIAAVREHPRESIIDLGNKLGMSRVTAGRKLQQLLDDKIIRVVSVARPSAFGFRTQAGILIRVQPGRSNGVVSALVRHPRINHVTLLSGRFNIFCWLIVHDTQELTNYLAEDLIRLPGVMHYETMLAVKTPKHLFAT